MSNFISDDMVSAALDFLAQDPHPIATARGDVTRAETKVKEVRARIFLSAEGPVEGRKAMAECNDSYLEACERLAQANEDLEAARSKVNWAATAIEVWRTANANARAAERIR